MQRVLPRLKAGNNLALAIQMRFPLLRRGRHCCQHSTRPPWGGMGAASTSMSRPPLPSTTALATASRPRGGTDASSVAGRRKRTEPLSSSHGTAATERGRRPATRGEGADRLARLRCHPLEHSVAADTRDAPRSDSVK